MGERRNSEVRHGPKLSTLLTCIGIEASGYFAGFVRDHFGTQLNVPAFAHKLGMADIGVAAQLDQSRAYLPQGSEGLAGPLTMAEPEQLHRSGGAQAPALAQHLDQESNAERPPAHELRQPVDCRVRPFGQPRAALTQVLPASLGRPHTEFELRSGEAGSQRPRSRRHEGRALTAGARHVLGVAVLSVEVVDDGQDRLRVERLAQQTECLIRGRRAFLGRAAPPDDAAEFGDELLTIKPHRPIREQLAHACGHELLGEGRLADPTDARRHDGHGAVIAEQELLSVGLFVVPALEVRHRARRGLVRALEERDRGVRSRSFAGLSLPKYSERLLDLILAPLEFVEVLGVLEGGAGDRVERLSIGR